MNQFQQQLLSDCQNVLQLKYHPGWQVIVRDAQANFDTISASWFELEEDSPQLKDARSRQIANGIILSMMDLYEAKLKEVSLELIEKDAPELLQTTDVDNGLEEDQDE